MDIPRQRIIIGVQVGTKKLLILGGSSANFEHEAIEEVLTAQNKDPREWDAIAPDFSPRSSNRATEIALFHFFEGLNIPRREWTVILDAIVTKLKEAGQGRQIL